MHRRAEAAVELAVPRHVRCRAHGEAVDDDLADAAERVAVALRSASICAIIARLGVGVERAERRRVGGGVDVRRHRGRAALRRCRRGARGGCRCGRRTRARRRLQTAPAATRAVVSRADARSRMSRASSRSYLSTPVRSAWPGRTRVTARLRGCPDLRRAAPDP